MKGDIEVHYVLATSLPTSHPTHEEALELHETLKTPQPRAAFDFFIGILSAANHFAERMAIRKTWMQSKMIKTSKVVARFFIAMVITKITCCLKFCVCVREREREREREIYAF